MLTGLSTDSEPKSSSPGTDLSMPSPGVFHPGDQGPYYQLRILWKVGMVLTEAGSKPAEPWEILVASLRTPETIEQELKIKIKREIKSKSFFSSRLLEILYSQCFFMRGSEISGMFWGHPHPGFPEITHRTL